MVGVTAPWSPLTLVATCITAPDLWLSMPFCSLSPVPSPASRTLILVLSLHYPLPKSFLPCLLDLFSHRHLWLCYEGQVDKGPLLGKAFYWT